LSATATPPTMMNLTSAPARLSNNFSYGVSIIARSGPRKLCHKAVQTIKLVPNIDRLFFPHDFLDSFAMFGPVHDDYLIAASFFRSTRLIHSCNSVGSWFCNSI
jgi:hypothetical protein